MKELLIRASPCTQQRSEMHQTAHFMSRLDPAAYDRRAAVKQNGPAALPARVQHLRWLPVQSIKD